MRPGSWFEKLADVEQLSAKLLPVADAKGAMQLIDADINQLADPLALLSLTGCKGACVTQKLFDAMADVAHSTSTAAPGQRLRAYFSAARFDSARVYHVIGRAPCG